MVCPRSQRTPALHLVIMPAALMLRLSPVWLLSLRLCSLLWWLVRKGDEGIQHQVQSVSPVSWHRRDSASSPVGVSSILASARDAAKSQSEELEQLSCFLRFFKRWSVTHVALVRA
jgi:hypothetical protein